MKKKKKIGNITLFCLFKKCQNQPLLEFSRGHGSEKIFDLQFTVNSKVSIFANSHLALKQAGHKADT